MFKKTSFFKLFLPVTLCLSLLLPAVTSNAALANETGSAASIVATNAKVLNEGNWAPATRQAIQNLINNNGTNSPNYSINKKPYVVFDWDNTCTYADTEESTLIYQLENLKYKMTPEQFRLAFTTGNNAPIPETDFVDPYKNEAGQPVNITKIANDVCKDYQFFWDNYRGLNPNAANNLTIAQIKDSAQLKDFEAKFWFTYSAMDATFGYDISWTWLLNFFAGYTPAEVNGLASEAIDYAALQDIKDVYFDSTLPGEAGIIKNSNPSLGNYFRQGLRATPEIKDLMATLRDNGIDVYISTASLDSVVGGFAANPKYGYNVPAEQIIGMRLKLDSNGKYLSEIPDPNTYAINAKMGKAVNINNLLAAQKKINPIMIVGDSDGDYEMMTQLSGDNNVYQRINAYDPVKMVLIINRLKGGTLGQLCTSAASQIGAPYPFILLQGRDENTGSWIKSEQTIKLGKHDSKLLK
jgi:Phosphoserine phosphatase